MEVGGEEEEKCRCLSFAVPLYNLILLVCMVPVAVFEGMDGAGRGGAGVNYGITS